MGLPKQYGFCRPKLQGFFAYFLSLKESMCQAFFQKSDKNTQPISWLGAFFTPPGRVSGN
jgi:hypothetical protein